MRPPISCLLFFLDGPAHAHVVVFVAGAATTLPKASKATVAPLSRATVATNSSREGTADPRSRGTGVNRVTANNRFASLASLCAQFADHRAHSAVRLPDRCTCNRDSDREASSKVGLVQGVACSLAWPERASAVALRRPSATVWCASFPRPRAAFPKRNSYLPSASFAHSSKPLDARTDPVSFLLTPLLRPLVAA